MPAERAEMRKVREILRLKHAHQMSERQISLTVGLSRSTVSDYLLRAATATYYNAVLCWLATVDASGQLLRLSIEHE